MGTNIAERAWGPRSGRNKPVLSEPALVVADGKFDIADPDPRAGLKAPQRAGSHGKAVDRRAVGGAQVLDLQRVVDEDQPRMASRHRRMRQNRVAMVEIAADHEAFRLSLHQPVERQVETELAPRQVGAVEPQRCARHDGRRGPPRSAHPGAHMIDMEGPADILGAMLAAVYEG